jgi:hypothetical protein
MEFDEEERLHRQRQLDWTEERLKREGYMLDGMGASPGMTSKKKEGVVVYTFAKTGRDATSTLPFNRLT